MTDFRLSTDRDIATFIESQISEFGDYRITADTILAKKPVFERFEHGFAVIKYSGTCHVELWFLYVDPDYRGRGLGKEYAKHIKRKYGQHYPITLQCHERLQSFYASLDFRVTDCDGDCRLMVG